MGVGFEMNEFGTRLNALAGSATDHLRVMHPADVAARAKERRNKGWVGRAALITSGVAVAIVALGLVIKGNDVRVVTTPAGRPAPSATPDDGGSSTTARGSNAATAAPCDPGAGHVDAATIEVVLQSDVPSPRCVRAQANERLRVLNGTSDEITISLKDRGAQIPPGGSHIYDEPLRSWLVNGAHCLSASLYPDGCVEIHIDAPK